MKLVDESGFLLGIFSLPNRETNMLRERKVLSVMEDYPFIDLGKQMEDPAIAMAKSVKVWRLLSDYKVGSDAFILENITVEEFERQRLVAFSPSLAYVLKLISNFPR